MKFQTMCCQYRGPILATGKLTVLVVDVCNIPIVPILRRPLSSLLGRHLLRFLHLAHQPVHGLLVRLIIREAADSIHATAPVKRPVLVHSNHLPVLRLHNLQRASPCRLLDRAHLVRRILFQIGISQIAQLSVVYLVRLAAIVAKCIVVAVSVLFPLALVPFLGLVDGPVPRPFALKVAAFVFDLGFEELVACDGGAALDGGELGGIVFEAVGFCLGGA